ncbi:MAG: adenylate/guanylate cyclase domain-containing protein [bacterium]|nr:adenylate/guanylate cyclase domain-containing protein [bacterium]MDT8367164.1 adenylate/guanylate cyclase domain-containing protein [bacterium]
MTGFTGKGTIRREDAFTIIVQNSPMDIAKALLDFGLTWLLGLLFFLIGAIVFYMKPGTESSRAFLLAPFTVGIFLIFTYTSKLTPDWLNIMLIFSSTFIPATVFHLAAMFPAEQKWVKKRKWILVIPYSIAATLFIALVISTDIYTDAPNYLLDSTEIFRGIALLFFLGSILLAVIRTKEPLPRTRAIAVSFGLPALIVPTVQLFSGVFFDIRIVSHPLYYMPFYVFFPLATAYAIIKHNIFDVDVFIRRTVGYSLMTLFVGLLFVAMAVSVRPITLLFPAMDKISGLYPVLFALFVVFFFRPIQGRLQRAVNRLFYREKYDYKGAVTTISNELTTVLDLNKVIIMIIHAARDVMSIDSAGVILLQPKVGECPALFVHDPPAGDKEEKIEDICFDLNDPVISLLKEERKLVTRDDLLENPKYSEVKDECLHHLDKMRGFMALPLVFQDRLIGILILGLKKSGRFYNLEDMDLLITLADQGAIAIENAKRAESMKSEEVVRANLARYLSPQVVDQVISKNVKMDLGGEKKVVTVLISDIRGFTRLTETQPPDRLVTIINGYFTEMAQVIFDNQGSLDKYIGDAIVASYGSLIEVDNPTAQAVKTAIDMIDRMTRLNRKWAEEFDGLHMDIGIGVDTGEVFLGNVGSPDRMEFTVIGSAVNNAQFCSDTAGPNEILLSETAAAALGAKVGVRELDEFPGQPDALKILKVVR